MAVTWGEIKLSVLQSLNITSETTLSAVTDAAEYLNRMPAMANKAQQILMVENRPIIKQIQLSQNPVNNLLASDGDYTMFNIYQHLDEDIEYSADGAKAYYFEVDNDAEIYVEFADDDTEIAHILHTATTPNTYTAYKAKISNPTDREVRIRFSGSYVYSYRNIALYGYTFKSDALVPTYTAEVKYDLTALASDFYRLSEHDVVFQGDYNNNRYNKTKQYYFEGDHTIVLDYFAKGLFTIHYQAYPAAITSSTADSYVIPMSDESAYQMVNYIAGQVYADDDIQIATKFMNEFEVYRASIKPISTYNDYHFKSESGWI